MKFRLLLSFLLLFSVQAFSQLSLEGTINYIDEKMNECDGLRHTYYTPSFYRMSNLEFGIRANDKNMLIANITHTYESGVIDEMQYIFDPTHIKSFAYYLNSLDGVEFIVLQLTGKTAIIRKKRNGTLTETNDDSIKIPFVNVDPLNKERMRKAFLLLKKYYVAKKGSDPFAN